MGRRGVGARGQQRHERGIIATELRRPADAGVVDLGDEIAFAQTRLDLVDNAGMHRLDEPRRLAHIFDLGGALHRALPVDEAGRIGKAGVGKISRQRP